MDLNALRKRLSSSNSTDRNLTTDASRGSKPLSFNGAGFLRSFGALLIILLLFAALSFLFRSPRPDWTLPFADARVLESTPAAQIINSHSTGSLILVGGDPSVGKSTLLLQNAAIIAEGATADKPGPVLYVSGEESVEQIGQRADRMRIATEELFLYSSTDIEDIINKVRDLSTRALVVDSIQTVYLKGVTGSPRGIQQVKECTTTLLRFAKSTNIPVLLIGHMNKSSEIAGPRVLEHIVDVVLYMESRNGDPKSSSDASL